MDLVKKYYGHVFLAWIAVLPVMLWLAAQGLSPFTQSIGSFIASLGKTTALAGIALYSFMPVLSMRHAIIEAAFGGLDKVYRFHASSGKLSFYLILLHPIFLGAGRLLDGRSWSELWSWGSLEISLGIFGLLAMTIVTGITIYAHIRHQSWVIIHRFFGWLIPIYFLHAILTKGQITQIQPLLWYMSALALLGFCAFLYRSVFAHYFVKKYRYEIAEVRHVNSSVTELTLKPTRIPINYQPGQYGFLSIDSLEVDAESHPFSFTTANNGPYVRFAIKSLGDDTEKIKKVSPGELAFIEGPYGNFNYRNLANTKQVWVAGGVGITPFLSMARSLGDNKTHNITLFYAAEKLEDAVFLQEILDIKRTVPQNFDVVIVDKKVSGYVSAQMIKDQLGDLATFDYMICGPPGLMDAMEKGLLQAGITESQIHMERFSM